jgi:hypothetical protein
VEWLVRVWVRAVVVEVALVLGRDRGCVALVDDEDPVEKFVSDGGGEPFGDRVRAGRSNRRLVTGIQR